MLGIHIYLLKTHTELNLAQKGFFFAFDVWHVTKWGSPLLWLKHFNRAKIIFLPCNFDELSKLVLTTNDVYNYFHLGHSSE